VFSVDSVQACRGSALRQALPAHRGTGVCQKGGGFLPKRISDVLFAVTSSLPRFLPVVQWEGMQENAPLLNELIPCK